MVMALKKLLAYSPAVMISVALTFIVGAVLPPLAGLAIFVAGLVAMLALLVGLGEDLAVRILHRARRPSRAETDALAPAVAMLCQRGVPMEGIRLRVQESSAPIAAHGTGRRTLVVSAGLLGAVRDDQLPIDQTAAVLAHGTGVVLSGAVRSDPALEFWTLPWQVVRGLAHLLILPFRRLPLVGLAWKGRFLVAVIAAAQAVIADQTAVAAAIASGCALTYVAGVWERSWAAAVRDLGDDQVRQWGLADSLARVLLRCSSSAQTHERAHALSGPSQRPTLALVTPPM